MSSFSSYMRSVLAAIVLLAAHSAANAQAKPPRTPPQTDDVVSINADLVQTDVTVLDKHGRFVDKLRREQFELLVDGKPQPITFFERLVAGSTSEELQIDAARGTSTSGTVARRPERGRTIFFFVDDLHMSSESLIRTRKALEQFVENEVGHDDQVAITSATGQIGFLQQLTNNKVVLRAAIRRIKSSSQLLLDPEYPPMSEVMALAIDVYHDQDVLKYFVEAMAMRNGAQMAFEEVVKARAKRILQQSAFLTRSTLATLENLARTSADLPGRKLVFFISDGFLLNSNESDMMDRIRNITNASAKNGIVIYTLDSRGLAVVGLGDATNTSASSGDPRGEMQGVVSRYAGREISQSQEPLRMISANTGGRALLNSNSLKSGFTKAIQETSTYYLLAWRPENGVVHKDQFRQLDVRVVGRPDLNVQVRRGYYDVAPSRIAGAAEPVKPAPPAKVSQAALKEAIQSPYPTRALPTQLGLYYLNTPDKGVVLTASIQIARQFMTFSHSEDKQSALLDLTGVVLDDQGKRVAGFTDRLNVAVYFPQYVGQPRRDLVYNFQSPLKAGLYQVRVAVRDSKGGRTGSAMQWIEIPDLASRRLSVSSLILAETTKDALEIGDNGAPAESLLSVDRRFSRTSKLRLMTYIYNFSAGVNATSPDVVTEMQILGDGRPITTTSPRKVQTTGLADPTRLVYAAEIPLESLPPGRYVLQVKVTDRIANSTASQQADFEIE